VSEDEIVVDASAALALLKGEPIRDFDPERIVGAAISAVNFSESLATLISEGLSEEQADEALSTLDLRVVPFNESQARATAQLRPKTRHLDLSLGDRACLALAMQLKAPAVTADRVWNKLKIGVEVVVIR
jgi:PIN domain nuclease of toxin-antitoxin system